MTQFIGNRIKSFMISQMPGHILIFLLLWIVSYNIRIWVVFLAVYIAAISIGLLRDIFIAWRNKKERMYARQVRRLILLVRNLIDLAYVHEDNPEKFYRKFLETVSVASLRERGIIDPESLVHVPKFNRMYKEMRPEDAEFWTLLMAGFMSRELKIIFGHSNINSVYIKRHRLKLRLEKQMSEVISKINN